MKGLSKCLHLSDSRKTRNCEWTVWWALLLNYREVWSSMTSYKKIKSFWFPSLGHLTLSTNHILNLAFIHNSYIRIAAVKYQMRTALKPFFFPKVFFESLDDCYPIGLLTGRLLTLSLMLGFLYSTSNIIILQTILITIITNLQTYAIISYFTYRYTKNAIIPCILYLYIL